jgi:hypothetical protein
MTAVIILVLAFTRCRPATGAAAIGWVVLAAIAIGSAVMVVTLVSRRCCVTLILVLFRPLLLLIRMVARRVVAHPLVAALCGSVCATTPPHHHDLVLFAELHVCLHLPPACRTGAAAAAATTIAAAAPAATHADLGRPHHVRPVAVLGWRWRCR